jgi:SAM-dependent methyltransferase
MDRRSRILDGLDLSGLGLEIGPSYSPIAAGDPALRVKTLDHIDQAALIEKYRNDPLVDVGRIQPVDYVWSGERYIDLVGDTRFDWIVASHVIEHVPDVVGFINECAEILTPGGVLSLAVPDKRYEFDYYRPPTGLARLVDAHYDGRRLTSPGSVAEHLLNHATLDGRQTWSEHEQGVPSSADDFDLVRYGMDQTRRGEYVDMHAWAFTPHSFRLAMHDLHKLGLLTVKELSFSGSVGCEFYCQLSLAGAGDVPDRLTMNRRALRELMSATSEEAPARPGAETLKTENADLRRRLTALEASSSWRLTAPLRALAGLTGLHRRSL